MFNSTKNNRFSGPVNNRVMAMTVLLSCTMTFLNAQDNHDTSAADNSSDTSKYKMSLKAILQRTQLSGTFRMRYTSSFNNNVDILGLQHSTNTPSFSTNSFTIPQARIVVSGNITEKMSIYFRANFGEFSTNPQSKVLEYAYGTFSFNKYLNVRMGLLKPYFGREDDISTDFLKSFDYSNQYTAFGLNGWTNFQLGATVFGETKISEKIPLRYYAGVFNGNGRINFTDNENGKQFTARLESDLTNDIRLGVSGGLGNEFGSTISAWGLDLYYDKDVSSRWNIELESEFKQGNNQGLFFSQSIPGKTVKDFMIRGLYILPSIEYKINSMKGLGLEASFKYEYLNQDFKQDGNVWNEYVPMVGIDFKDQFAIRLQIGIVMDRFTRNVENTNNFNSSRFITQLQLRF